MLVPTQTTLRPRLVFDTAAFNFVEHRFYEMALAEGHVHLREDRWHTSTSSVQELNPVVSRNTRGTSEGIARFDQGLLQYRLHGGEVVVRVAATANDDVRNLKIRSRKLFPRSVPPPETHVEFRLWSMGEHGPSWRTRAVEAPVWTDIAGNYGDAASGQLSHLHGHFRPADGGRLLIFHGPPGTGKTSVIRSLARAWRTWCRVDVVLDPETLLGGRPDYLLRVLTEEDAGDSARWNLLVLEDTGELLQADARERTGQGLSRFLNVLDGLLGQGTRTLALLTTNEPISSLHPAVVRPGRCAAKIEFPELDPDEAGAWRVKHGLPALARAATLAELYAELAGRTATAPAVSAMGFR